MSKILNLDEVSSKEERVLKIKGVEYEMSTMSVQDFIDMSRKEERLVELGEDAPISEQFVLYMDIVGSFFPTIPEDVLKSFTLEQLMAILDFAREIESGADEVEAEQKKPGKSNKK